MSHDIKDIFQKAIYTPDSRLSGDIGCFIIKKEERILKIKLWAYSFIGVASFLAFIPVFKNLLDKLSMSGFYQYSSLVFSDGGVISYYWKEFLLSLTDALPFTSLLFSLLLLFILFISIKKSLEQYRYKLLLA